MPKSSPDNADCALSVQETEDLVSEMIGDLREKGFRRTEGLVDLLRAMMRQHQPYTLAQLWESPGLRERDQATVYRLIMKLKEAGMVRQLNLAGRVNHFQLVVPGHHHDYLLCESCGSVTEVPVNCPLAEVELQIMAKFGWKGLHHELEFFGICPVCAGS